jgi:hypothetical protein
MRLHSLRRWFLAASASQRRKVRAAARLAAARLAAARLAVTRLAVARRAVVRPAAA